MGMLLSASSWAEAKKAHSYRERLEFTLAGLPQDRSIAPIQGEEANFGTMKFPGSRTVKNLQRFAKSAKSPREVRHLFLATLSAAII
jgi:hypothetical protein